MKILLKKILKIQHCVFSIYELDNEDRKSLLAEYREWIMNDLDFEEIMMLPYEAYTDKLDSNFLDDTL